MTEVVSFPALSFPNLEHAFVEFIRDNKNAPDALIVSPELHATAIGLVQARFHDTGKNNPYFIMFGVYVNYDFSPWMWFLGNRLEPASSEVRIPYYGEGPWYQM